MTPKVKRDVISRLEHDLVVLRCGLVGGSVVPEERKCLHLGMFIGNVAHAISEPAAADTLEHHLKRLYGFCCGWLAAAGQKNISNEIRGNRVRMQRNSAPILDTQIANEIKFKAILELAGGVASAVQRPHKHDILTNQLILLAAVCVAWLESLNQKGTK